MTSEIEIVTPRAGRPVEAQGLEAVERVGHLDLRVDLGEPVDRTEILAEDLLVDLDVDEGVVLRERPR